MTFSPKDATTGTAAAAGIALRATRGTVLVLPQREKGLNPTEAADPTIPAVKIGSIWLPATAENPESQQGVVVASSVPDLYRGARVLHHPYQSQSVIHRGQELLWLLDRSVVCLVSDDRLVMRKDNVLIHPEWRADKLIESGGLWLEQSLDLVQPQLIGHVVGLGPDTKELCHGLRVLIPPMIGHEVAWIDRVYYIISEQDILAVIGDTPACKY